MCFYLCLYFKLSYCVFGHLCVINGLTHGLHNGVILTQYSYFRKYVGYSNVTKGNERKLT